MSLYIYTIQVYSTEKGVLMDHDINHEHTQHEDQQMGASHHEHEGMIGDFKKRFPSR